MGFGQREPGALNWLDILPPFPIQFEFNAVVRLTL